MTENRLGRLGFSRALGPARILRGLAALAVASHVWNHASAQSDDDVVVTENGDRLTGEIKSLDRGLLRFETDATDTIEIKWTHVASLVSDQNFRVTLDDGRELFGSLDEADATTMLRLSTVVGSIDLPILTVVRMMPIEGRLVDQIDMSFDLGYNITKANSVAQADIGYNFTYRTEQRLLSFNADATRSASSDQDTSIRANSTFSYRRFVGDRLWDPVGFGAIERNDELGLDRRITLGGGMSRWLTDTSSNRISFMGGLVGTRENERDALESENSLEAAAAISLDWFRHDDPELDVSMLFSVYERLSDSSRTRGNFDVDLRWELLNDFFWGFSIYYSFNTKPTGEAEREDYGVVTSIGWSF